MYRCQDSQLGTFWLIDTPGFNDTYLSDAQVLEEIAEWLSAAYRERIQLTGIIYLQSIQNNKFAGTSIRSIVWFRELCGNDALSKVFLVTSFWDNVPAQLPWDEALYRERQLKENKDYWKRIISRGARTERHNNTHESARTIIRRVIATQTDDSPGTYTRLQREMVDEHRPLNQTTVGQNIARLLDQDRIVFEQELEDLRGELDRALREQNEQHRRDVEAQQKENERIRRHLEEDQERLRRDVSKLDRRCKELEREATAEHEAELRQQQREMEGLEQELQRLNDHNADIQQRNERRDALEARRQRIEQLKREQLMCIVQ